MAISKIKVGSVEHELETTIANVDGLQAALDGKAASSHTHSNESLGQGRGTCSTPESTAEKVVSISDYTLTKGGIVSVKFYYSVNASATMNINSNGAKDIYYNDEAITDDVIKGGDTATFIYSGSRYHLISIDRWHEDIIDLQANDSKVKQMVAVANSNYPLLFASNFQEETTTGFTYFNGDIYANPSLNRIYADISGTATGIRDVTAGNFLVGNGDGEMVQKTPAEVLTDIGAMDLDSAQTATGVKTFTNGINIGNATMTYDTTNKCVVISVQ